MTNQEQHDLFPEISSRLHRGLFPPQTDIAALVTENKALKEANTTYQHALMRSIAALAQANVNLKRVGERLNDYEEAEYKASK